MHGCRQLSKKLYWLCPHNGSVHGFHFSLSSKARGKNDWAFFNKLWSKPPGSNFNGSDDIIANPLLLQLFFLQNLRDSQPDIGVQEYEP